jgi:glycosyltransferase involved in cell wall biosynthesis
MRISLTIPLSNTVTNHGYGVAAQGMVASLQRLGHEVPFQDVTAPVEIAFCQPDIWEWSSPDSYKIGYVPWESTKLPDRWIPYLKECDEVWTTSDWAKLVFEKHGLVDVRVYEHGVDTGPEGWTRKRRRPENRPIRFLHIGEPAPRKAGQLVYDTFEKLFGQSGDATLTIKAHGYNTVRAKNGLRPDKVNPHVKVIAEEFELFEMIDLVHRHDVLVYPSWGEGFGLIPLQAMATGMPVICTAKWAPYRAHLVPELALPSKLTVSPWPDIHSGFMYKPDEDHLTESMRTLAGIDYENYSLKAYAQSFGVERDYDWDTLTQNAFDHIEEKFSS